MYFKKPHSLATSNSECNLHCRKLTFYFINILLDNFVLLRKVKFCCAHIKCRTFFRQIDLPGSPGIYLIQTDAGSLCKFFVTDPCTLQTAEHPHCFVLYGHFIYLRFCCSRCIFILDILLPEERRKNRILSESSSDFYRRKNTSLRTGGCLFPLPSMTI